MEQILREGFPDCQRMLPASLCFFTFEIEIFVPWIASRAQFHALSSSSGIMLETPGLIASYS
jgi:hypothetical protein